MRARLAPFRRSADRVAAYLFAPLRLLQTDRRIGRRPRSTSADCLPSTQSALPCSSATRFHSSRSGHPRSFATRSSPGKRVTTTSCEEYTRSPPTSECENHKFCNENSSPIFQRVVCCERRIGIGLSEADPFTGEPVERRCRVIGLSSAAEIGITAILDYDENNVRPSFWHHGMLVQSQAENS